MRGDLERPGGRPGKGVWNLLVKLIGLNHQRVSPGYVWTVDDARLLLQRTGGGCEPVRKAARSVVNILLIDNCSRQSEENMGEYRTDSGRQEDREPKYKKKAYKAIRQLRENKSIPVPDIRSTRS